MKAQKRIAALEAELAAAKADATSWKEAHAVLARSMQPWPALQIAPAIFPTINHFLPLLPPPPIVSVEPIWPYQPTVTC